MRIPSGRAKLLSDYQNALFYNPTEPKNKRIYVFYLLVKPLLLWSAKSFKQAGLEKDEIESEFYLLAAKLFENFDVTKSSIVPYLEKRVPWYVKKRLDSINKYCNKINALVDYTYSCTMEGISQDFLFSAQKLFTADEIYVISKVLTLDKEDLNTSSIAEALKVNRKTVYKYLDKIAQKLNQGRIVYDNFKRQNG
jgi:predicted DNA-binding protein YlxM (UPF0122 family)